MATKGYQTKLDWMAKTSKNPNKPLPVATALLRVQFEESAIDVDSKHDQILFEQILRRHTDRRNYDLERPPSNEFISSLLNYQAGNQNVGILDRTNRIEDFEKIASWVKQAWEIELATPSTAMESIRSLRIGDSEINEHRDGIVIDNAFLVILNKLGMFDRTQPLTPGSSNYTRQVEQFNEAINSTPAWFYLTSDTNSRMDQVDSGRTFVKAQLRATQQGMVMHPVSQGLQEYKEMSALYEDTSKHINTLVKKEGATVQMLARVGYLPEGTSQSTPAPRKGLNAQII